MGVMDCRRRILMAQDGFIPPGYQRYDYLQTVRSKSYFDSGVAGNNDSIKIDATLVPYTHSSYSPILGNYNGDNQETCWMLRYGGVEKQLNFVLNTNKVSGGSYNLNVDDNTVVGKRLKIHMEKGFAVVNNNGDEFSCTITGDAPISTLNIYIGNYAAPVNYGAYTRFYSVKIFKSGVITRNYVPVVRKSDSKPGFYDTVNHTFNPSIGSADFVAGND